MNGIASSIDLCDFCTVVLRSQKNLATSILIRNI